VETAELKILLAIEPHWTVSLNDLEFLDLRSSEISIEDSTIKFAKHGKYSAGILSLEWVRHNVIRIRTTIDTITLYAGDHLPATADHRRRRRSFQIEISRALRAHFQVRNIERQTLYSDRRHGIGGAYPRFLVGNHAAIAVDPLESSDVVNGIMRAALLWVPLVRRPVVVIVPHGRQQTLSARLRIMNRTRGASDWLAWLTWDGETLRKMEDTAAEPETHVQEFRLPDVSHEVGRIRAIAPDLLHAVPHIAGHAISVRLRGIEVARVAPEGTSYPLGEPIEKVVREIAEARRHGSRHPLAHAHQERWLESNLIGVIREIIPSIDSRHIYPQVPSFVGEERNIIDLLTVTNDGRLVVIEIKASPDPDLPFQALDYWIAVERHRKAGDFSTKGYFAGLKLKDEPALLVLVSPLLAYHKTSGRLIATLPAEVPLLEIGINQTWKREIKVLRRKGMLS
jgi:hypothetical protein